MTFLYQVIDDTPHSSTAGHKIQRYVIVGLACAAAIVTLFVYQNMDSKVQPPIQNTSNITNPEQTIQTTQSSYTPQEPSTQSAINITLVEQDIHKIVNQTRLANGAQPINYDPKLADIARAHSQDMAIHQFLSHNSYEGTQSLSYRYMLAGYHCPAPADSYEYPRSNENIAVVTAQGNESQIARHIVNTWLDSVADNYNILDNEYQVEGIGIALTGNKMAVYATEDFC